MFGSQRKALPPLPPLRVRAVPGRLVTRFGVKGGGYIGATRKGSEIEWTEDVVEIPGAEYQAARRAYDRAIQEGDLERVTDEPADAGRKE